ncbi:S-layer homology domain-containing protein [Paenibacillus jamilae]|uniref:S-layer homology domain-containing protein n=1 Tax=Paenibacillus jamilae TaxID=114136 RepID=UPI0004B19B60|nr:S-layer homology domain-containing protein [Paenibacillus jamilae]
MEKKGDTSAIVNKANTVSFTDQSKNMSSEALQAVQEAVKQGLITDYPDGSFRPDEPLTHCGGGSSTTNPTPTSTPTPNHVPVTATVPPDQYGIVGSGDTLVDLKNVFFSADQDELSYHVITSDVYVVEAEVASQQLTLKPKSAGSTQVFVTAEDGKGGRASVFFTYTVTGSTYSSTLT